MRKREVEVKVIVRREQHARQALAYAKYSLLKFMALFLVPTWKTDGLADVQKEKHLMDRAPVLWFITAIFRLRHNSNGSRKSECLPFPNTNIKRWSKRRHVRFASTRFLVGCHQIETYQNRI